MSGKDYEVKNGEFFGMDQYDVRPLDGRWWEIQNPSGAWGFDCESDGKRYRVLPRDKAKTDFASIPFYGILWKVIGPPTGYGEGRAYGPPAIVHDEPYTTGTVLELQPDDTWKTVNVHRQFVDNLFDCAMRCQVSVERWVIEETMPVKKTFVLVDVSRWRRNIMHRCVLIGGRGHWAKHGHPLD